MEKKDFNRFTHMLDAAKAVCRHIVDKQAVDLERDRLLLGGIIRELLLIGEAANAISSQQQSNTPLIPWRKVIGMRNQLIHGYFEINYQVIWVTVTQDIPELIVELERVLADADR